MSKTKRLTRNVAVTAPVVETIGHAEVITFIIGGRKWSLSAVDSPVSRHAAAALHMATSVALVIVEDERFPFPEDHS